MTNCKLSNRFPINLCRTMELWINLYNQLSLITVDPRPEVRHSALRTLTFVMASNGDQLDKEKWIQCMELILVLLESIHEAALRAEQSNSSP